MKTENYEVISRNQVLHRADSNGPRITETQVVRVNGQIFNVNVWTDFSTGKVVKVDSFPAK